MYIYIYRPFSTDFGKMPFLLHLGIFLQII